MVPEDNVEPAGQEKALAKEKPQKAKPKKPEVRKRELKSAKRKEGVPDLKKPKKKSKKKYWIGGLIAIILFTSLFFLPRFGTINYGICKTFVELHDPYPSFLEFVEAYEDGNLTIIDYNRVDSFGQRSLNQIRCSFESDPEKLGRIKKVDVNGKANILPQEAPDVIKKFNEGVDAIIQSKPSLIMPSGLARDIKDYR